MNEEYVIIKFWHPASGMTSERWDDKTYNKAEAQAICDSEEASYEEGPRSHWYFLGFGKAEDW